MNEIGDTWEAIRAKQREEKRACVVAAPGILEAAGLKFEVFDSEGQHIRVENIYDFWPSTGLFIRRGSNKRMHSIEKLINVIKGKPV